MRTSVIAPVLAALAALLLVPPLIGAATGGGDGTQMRGLRFMVPNTPGGGYDITARTAAKSARGRRTQPQRRGVQPARRRRHRRPGPHWSTSSGNGKLAMSMGLGVVGAVHTNDSPATLADTTPIARLTEEPDDRRGRQGLARTGPSTTLLADWKENPGARPRRRRFLARRARTTSRRC